MEYDAGSPGCNPATVQDAVVLGKAGKQAMIAPAKHSVDVVAPSACDPHGAERRESTPTIPCPHIRSSVVGHRRGGNSARRGLRDFLFSVVPNRFLALREMNLTLAVVINCTWGRLMIQDGRMAVSTTSSARPETMPALPEPKRARPRRSTSAVLDGTGHGGLKGAQTHQWLCRPAQWVGSRTQRRCEDAGSELLAAKRVNLTGLPKESESS